MRCRAAMNDSPEGKNNAAALQTAPGCGTGLLRLPPPRALSGQKGIESAQGIIYTFHCPEIKHGPSKQRNPPTP